MNGYAKAAWAQGAKPKIDARLVTRNGVIGLSSDDPEYLGSTLKYDEVGLVAKAWLPVYRFVWM